MQNKRVLIIHTGGTFGMTNRGDDSTQMAPRGYLEQLLQKVPELQSIADIELSVLCNLDSSDFSPKEWMQLADIITTQWDAFDGFVVIHGTDTMAYTAAALSFCMVDVTKPIILTGSQRPLAELRSDARSNLIDSVELATFGFPEVMICFDSKVHRGSRATKYSSEHLQAFCSHNSAILGSFGVHFRSNQRQMARPCAVENRLPPVVDMRLDANVFALDCLPGMVLPEVVINAIVSSASGLLIRAFGSGNLPLREPSWRIFCERASSQRIPVVVGTQCRAGRVMLNAYENGRVFRDLGVLSALDMSFEAAMVKLMVMLGRKIDAELWQEFFSTPLAHECQRGLYEEK